VASSVVVVLATVAVGMRGRIGETTGKEKRREQKGRDGR
jgi:hypothetical protein